MNNPGHPAGVIFLKKLILDIQSSMCLTVYIETITEE